VTKINAVHKISCNEEILFKIAAATATRQHSGKFI